MSAATVSFKRKARKGPTNLRKRALDLDEDDADVKATVAAGVSAQQGQKKARLSISSPQAKEESSAHDEILASLVKPESNRSGEGRIVASSTVKTEDDKQKQQDTGPSVAFGASGVKDSIQKSDAFRTIDLDGRAAGDKPSKRFGPMRAPTNVRVTSRFDYQQDICKDYKETGYCGYGDSCIFLHDRGDYKTGWQLEREWQGKMQRLTGGRDQDYTIDANTFEIKRAGDDEDSDSDDDLPDECPICDRPFTNPVVTACAHYFDEACALKNERQNGGKCFECGAKTNGNFKVAKDILEKIKKEQAEAANDHSSSDDDDGSDDDSEHGDSQKESIKTEK